MTGYLVCDEPRGIECWLVLSPIAGYPSWTSRMHEATVMKFSLAHQCVTAFGKRINGEVRARVVETHRAPQAAKAIIEKIEEAAMQAQQTAMVDMCWGGDGS